MIFLAIALLVIGIVVVIVARIARQAPAEAHYIGYALIVISVVLLTLGLLTHGHP
jgi:chromate transport protein ChrA